MDTVDLAAAVVQAKMSMRERIDLNLLSLADGEKRVSAELRAKLEGVELPPDESMQLFHAYLLSQGRLHAMKALTAELLLS